MLQYALKFILTLARTPKTRRIISLNNGNWDHVMALNQDLVIHQTQSFMIDAAFLQDNTLFPVSTKKVNLDGGMSSSELMEKDTVMILSVSKQ